MADFQVTVQHFRFGSCPIDAKFQVESGQTSLAQTAGRATSSLWYGKSDMTSSKPKRGFLTVNLTPFRL